MISQKFIVGLSVVLLLSLVGVSVYFVALQAPFVFDDEPNITNNHALQITSVSSESLGRVIFESPLRMRPVANISFALNYLLHGYDLAGYRITNIFIHVLTSILLFCFVSSTLQLAYGGDKSKYALASLAAALLWLVHPVQVQSVTYIVQRMNSMAVMFYMLSFVLYVKARQSSGRMVSLGLFCGVLISWLLAMGSKEIVITLPFFVCLYELYFLQKKNVSTRRQVLLGLLPLFVGVAAAYFVLGSHPLDRLLHGYVNRDFTLSERLLTESRIVIFYISLLFYPNPSRLNLQHDFPLSTSLIDPWTTSLALLGILAMVVAACVLFRRQRLLSFSIVWFLGNLALESTIIPLELIFEHRLYLPSMAFCWFVAFVLTGIFSRKWLGFTVVCAVCLLFASWSYQRNQVWASPLDFARDSAEKSPALARVRGSYGEAMYKAGHFHDAIREFQYALELKPDYPEAHNALGNAYRTIGQTNAAEVELQKALVLNPNFIRAYNNIGILYLDMDKPELAIFHLKRAVQLRPDFIQAWYNLALAYEALGDNKEAEKCFRKALQFGSVPLVNFGLGVLFYEQERCVEAEEEFTVVLGLTPSDVEARRYLALVKKKCP